MASASSTFSSALGVYPDMCTVNAGPRLEHARANLQEGPMGIASSACGHLGRGIVVWRMYCSNHPVMVHCSSLTLGRCFKPWAVSFLCAVGSCGPFVCLASMILEVSPGRLSFSLKNVLPRNQAITNKQVVLCIESRYLSSRSLTVKLKAMSTQPEAGK